MFIKQQRMTPEQQERYQLLKQKWLGKLSDEKLEKKILKCRNKLYWTKYEVELAKRQAAKWLWRYYNYQINLPSTDNP